MVFARNAKLLSGLSGLAGGQELMIEAIVPLLIIMISLIGIKRRKEEDFLSIEQGNALKGISALLLVVVHIRERLEVVPVSYRILAGGGYLLVSVFFFYSGFGIVKQSLTKEHYVLDRLPKRILYLIEIIIGSEMVYYAFAVVLFGRSFSALDMLKCVIGIEMVNGALWTVFAMLILQAIYYFCYRLGFRNYTLIAVIGWAIYIFISVLRGRGSWEMQSCCSFVLGAYIAQNEKKTVEKYSKNIVLLITSFIVFIASFMAPYIFEYWLYEDLMLIRVVAGTIASLSFTALMLFVVNKVIISNGIIIYTGTLFTEIYLWHGLIIDIVKKAYPSAFQAGRHYAVLSVLIIMLVVTIAAIVKSAKKGFKDQKWKVKV